MELDIDKIKSYIDEVGGKILVEDMKDEPAQIIFEKYNNSLREKVRVGIIIIDNGRILEFVQRVASPFSSDVDIDRSIFMQTLLQSNSNTKLGSWSYTKEDEVVNFSVKMPVEDAILTSKQFRLAIWAIESSIINFFQIVNSLISKDEEGI